LGPRAVDPRNRNTNASFHVGANERLVCEGKLGRETPAPVIIRAKRQVAPTVQAEDQEPTIGITREVPKGKVQF